jgi:hypothetical protein
MTIRAKQFGEPLYTIDTRNYRGRFILIANEIGESGNNADIKAVYPVTSYIALGHQHTFWPYGGPAGVLRFNVSELEELINGIEARMHEHAFNQRHYVNAFRLGRWTGRNKEENFEVPVEFYQIEVDKSVKMKELGRTNPCKLWEVLVPRYSNQGAEYPIEYHKAWDEGVRQLAGGITILKTAKGHWVSPKGELFVDEMIPVRIYCDEEIIEKIIDHTLRYYEQKAVFAYELSSNVKVKHGDV